MVQIIPRVKSSGDRFAEAFANIGHSASQLIPEEIMGRRERKQLGGLIGEDVSDVRDPNFLKQVMAHGLDKKLQSEKLKGNLISDQQSTEVIQKYFGPNAAELWPHLTEGGKTAFFNSLMLGKERGNSVNQTLTEYLQSNPKEVKNIEKNINDSKTSEEPTGLDISGISEKGQEELSKKELEESKKYLTEVREKYQRAHA
jgi:hypothetical protein